MTPYALEWDSNVRVDDLTTSPSPQTLPVVSKPKHFVNPNAFGGVVFLKELSLCVLCKENILGPCLLFFEFGGRRI